MVWQTTPATDAIQSPSIERSSTENTATATSLPRVLVIYFPQYHPDPLNDKNWGVNFTDWDSLKAAPAKNRYVRPIPRPTEELGYYDLRDTAPRRQQAQLAPAHGIDGFIIHHYWFYDPSHPGPNLHAPLVEMLKDGEPNIPFFFNWCAERWTNVWMGRPLFQTIRTSMNRAITLQEQYFNVTDEMMQEHYAWLKQFFDLPDYLRVDGQPIFMIYQWHEEAGPIFQRLRALAVQDGFPGIYLLSGRSGSHSELYQIDYETLDGRMRGMIRRKTNPWELFPMDILNKTVAYPYPLQWINTSLSLPYWCTAPLGEQNQQQLGPSIISQATSEIPGVVTCFDNTPRREFESSAIWNPDETPDQVVERFSKSMVAALRFDACCLAHRHPTTYAKSEDRFVTVNAWNEWAEGMSLEPSDVFGHRLLQAILQAKQQVLREGCSHEVLQRSSGSNVGKVDSSDGKEATRYAYWRRRSSSNHNYSEWDVYLLTR